MHNNMCLCLRVCACVCVHGEIDVWSWLDGEILACHTFPFCFLITGSGDCQPTGSRKESTRSQPEILLVHSRLPESQEIKVSVFPNCSGLKVMKVTEVQTMQQKRRSEGGKPKEASKQLTLFAVLCFSERNFNLHELPTHKGVN